MAMLTLNPIRLAPLAVAAALALAPPAFAGDVSVKLDAGAGFSIRDETGSVERLRVDEATGNVSRNGALFVHTTGTQNLFVGTDAGNQATTGPGGNTGVGFRALFSNTTGSSNTAFGNQPLRNNTTGSQNSGLGSYALFFNTTGDRNVAVGDHAGQNLTTGSDNIYLANPGMAVESGRIRIGTDLTHTATYIAGIHGTTVGGAAAPVFVNASGQLGTGGGSLAPWTSPVDAGGNLLSQLAEILFQDLDSEWLGEHRTAFLSFNQDNTGIGWKVGAGRGSMFDASGLFPDSVFSINFNTDTGGSSPQSRYAPQVQSAYEGLFSYGTNYDPQLENYVSVTLHRDTVSLTSLSGGASFTVGEPLVVRRPGNGVVSGIGRVYSWSSPTLGIAWIRPGSPTLAPAVGDTVETDSVTTLTDVTGEAFTAGDSFSVYAGSGPCPDHPDTQVAILHLSAVSAPIGTTQAVHLIQSTGAGTDLAEGNRICSADGNPTGLLGTVSKTDTGVIGSGGFTDTTIANQRLGPRYDVRTQTLTADFGIRVNKDQIDNSWESFYTGEDVNNVPYVAILSNYNGYNGPDFNFAVGDAIHQFGSLFHGKIGIYDADSNYGFLEMANLTANHHYTFPNKDGTVAMLSDVGTGSGDVVSSGTSAVGGVPSFTDTSGNLISDSGMKIINEATTLSPSTYGPDEIRFYEDSDGDGTANYITLRGVGVGKTLTNSSGVLTMTNIPRASSGTARRGPVIGAVSNGSTFSTPEELCDVTYFKSSGVDQACIPGTAKTFDPTTAVASWISCADEVPTDTYYETVCTVE